MGMENKVILITGSTDGIGKQTALELASKGSSVWIHGRNIERCQVARLDIVKATGNEKVGLFVADLSSSKQVRGLAEKIKEKCEILDVLINNAGTYFPKRILTEENVEMTFAVNHLAYFLLTNLLLDLLIRSAPSRVINVSSRSHLKVVKFDNLQGENGYDGKNAYSLSKLCNVLFTYELAERLSGTGVTVNCLHPGVVETKLLHSGWDLSGRSVKDGAETSVYLASSPEVEGVTGKYYIDKQETRSSCMSYDRTLWTGSREISEKLSGLKTDCRTVTCSNSKGEKSR
ncbi:MAG: SDR family oxidoreductase [Anaerolineaceae bacterium]|nr:SDR family oxidoreductase [Anaerolineaceae bacterium]